MKKYLSLFWAFFKASAISDLEYRLNIVMKVFTDVMWYIAQLSVFEVLFDHTNAIAGWNIESMRVFMGVLFLIDAFWMLIFQENFDKFSEKIRKGDLDLLLAKPINAQFMMTFQKISVPYVFNIVISVTYLIYSLSHMTREVHYWQLIFLVISVPCALGITYGIRFFFSASALIFTRAENISYIWYQFYRLGMRPDAFYPPWLRYAILTIIPVGFIASVPARLLIETPDPLLIVGSVGLSALSIYISTRFWKFALGFYSSASS